MSKMLREKKAKAAKKQSNNRLLPADRIRKKVYFTVN